MKKQLIFLLTLISFAALAQQVGVAEIVKDIDPSKVAVIKEAVPPDWVVWLMQHGLSVPYIGPVLVFLLKWAGFLSVSLTALAAFLESMFISIAGAFNLVGLAEAAVKVKALAEKILPWVKYFSMFNVQKESTKDVIPSSGS